jgi:methionine-rich copper-binding protein CopC
VLAAACAPILLTSLAGVASAHAELVSSDPKDGSTVTTRPAVVTLTFEEDVDPKTARSRVEAEDDGLSYSADPKPRVQGAEVVVPLGQFTTAGTYTVTYRVVSEDSHPVEGSITFRAAERIGAAETTAPDTVALETMAPETTAPETTAPETTAPETAAPGVLPTDDIDPAWLYALGGLAIVGAAGTAIALVRRYRSP